MNYPLKEVEPTSGGIYLILNILECKAYVGQAKKFSKRTHVENLARGNDNSKLQYDFDDVEKNIDFIYFVVAYSDDNPIKRVLDNYEKLFMTLMEDLKFTLYNTNIKRQDREIEKLKIDIGEYYRAKKALYDDFEYRFDILPEELINADLDRRKEALNYYIKERMNEMSLKTDRFLFSKKHLDNILNMDILSAKTLNLDEMFVSKAGNYIGEGLDQILKIKTDLMEKYDYCLWAFANNAVSTGTVRKCCIERAKNGEDTYVIFTFTPSSAYASGDACEHSFVKLSTKRNKNITEEDINFLKLEKNEYKKLYTIPSDLVCTASSNTSANAFVIEKLYFLEEDIDEKVLKKQYMAVNAYNSLYDMTTSRQRSTFYVRLNEINNGVVPEDLFTEPHHRTICFVGKLASPFVIAVTPNG